MKIPLFLTLSSNTIPTPKKRNPKTTLALDGDCGPSERVLLSSTPCVNFNFVFNYSVEENFMVK